VATHNASAHHISTKLGNMWLSYWWFSKCSPPFFQEPYTNGDGSDRFEEDRDQSSVQACFRFQISWANLPNRYSSLCWRPVTHAQTWASDSALYRFGRLSISCSIGHIQE